MKNVLDILSLEATDLAVVDMVWADDSELANVGYIDIDLG